MGFRRPAGTLVGGQLGNRRAYGGRAKAARQMGIGRSRKAKEQTVVRGALRGVKRAAVAEEVTESLILAQDERWRRASRMQVERVVPRGATERRTGE